MDQERRDDAGPANREVSPRRLIRLTVVGCVVGLVAAWGVLIPLKVSAPTADDLTWPAVIVFPLASFGWVAGVVVLTDRYPRHPLAVMLGVSAVAAVLTAAVPLLFGPR